MSDPTVTLFATRGYEVSHLIEGADLNRIERKRMLTHVMGAVTQQILALPAANPVGLAVTVTEQPSCDAERPNLYVLATCPQYHTD